MCMGCCCCVLLSTCCCCQLLRLLPRPPLVFRSARLLCTLFFSHLAAAFSVACAERGEKMNLTRSGLRYSLEVHHFFLGFLNLGA